LRRRHDLDLADATGADQLGGVFRDLVTRLDDDFAGAIAGHRIDDIVDRNLAFDLGGAAAVDDLLDDRLVERADDLRVSAVLGAHGPQQRDRRELAALVDADAERVLLGNVDLDPATALRD